MAAFVVGFVLLLAMAGNSDANYCVCNSGVADNVLQKNIDYACGHGADCSAINTNGACYNPNTVKDHCNYAVNSYYQKQGQSPMSCDFQGTATVTSSPPSGGCVLQSSPSGGSTTPSTGGTTTPPTGGTPSTGGTTTPPTGGTTTPPTGGTTSPPTGGSTSPTTGGTPTTGGGTTSPTTGGTPTMGGGTSPTMGGTPNTGIGTGPTNPGTVGGSIMSPPGIGLAPTGSGYGNTDSSASVKLQSQNRVTIMLVTLLLSGLMCRRI